MTIKFPDVSHHNAPLSMTGAPVVIAKATEGAGFQDPAYSNFKKQAASMAVPFMGYHWVNTDSIASQAINAHSVMLSTPCMWDAEAIGVSVPRLVQLTNAYRLMGGVVHMVYLPHWFWQFQMGSPDLTPLAQLGLHLVSSNYTTYSDTGPGWAPYGGMTPVQWQYADNVVFNGKAIDFNAYKGTQQEYAQLISGGNVALTQADVDAVVAGVFTHMINAISLGYNQPFSEYVKYIKSNSNGIQDLEAKVDKILALLAAGANGVTVAQVQEIVAGSKIVPEP